MLIDWFTVGVQIVNFLVLIALLRRFLYAPLLRALDERQQAISDSLARAARAEQEAKAQVTALTEEREELVASRERLRSQAAGEIEAWRLSTQERLRQEIDQRKRLWQRQIADQERAFCEKLQRKIGEQVVRVAAQVLTDLADQRLEARLIDGFLARMGRAEDFARAPPLPSGDLLVITAHPLSAEVREGLRQQLASRFGAGRAIRFQEQPGLGFGIRLTCGDQAWEWNLSRYMEGLEQEIRQTLASAGQPGESDG